MYAHLIQCYNNTPELRNILSQCSVDLHREDECWICVTATLRMFLENSWCLVVNLLLYSNPNPIYIDQDTKSCTKRSWWLLHTSGKLRGAQWAIFTIDGTETRYSGLSSLSWSPLFPAECVQGISVSRVKVVSECKVHYIVETAIRTPLSLLIIL